ncbi:hypothetical protein AX17_007402 [Amanita inopinata Kibby_2008]|nr:hypothetical protein AX17_007402 [Amanita inopinata Kibby_2008]
MASGSSFGGSSIFGTKPQGTSLFGATQQQPSTSTTTQTPNIFGQTTQQQQPSTGGVFGQPTQPSQQQQPQSTFGTTPVFGGGTASIGTTQPQSSPFGSSTTSTQQPQAGLFGGSMTTTQQPQTGLFVNTTTTQQPQTGVFGGSSIVQQPQAGPFGSTTTTQQPQPGLFGSTTQPQTTGGGLFAGGFGSTQAQPQPQATQPAFGGTSIFNKSFQPQQQQQQFVPATSAITLTKTTKFNDFPEDVRRELEYLDSFIQSQIQISKDLHQRKLGEEPLKGHELIKGVQKDFTNCSNIVRQDLHFMRDLKAKVDRAVEDTIIATRIVDGFRNPQAGGGSGSGYLKEHAGFPYEYFTRITEQLGARLVWYKATVEVSKGCKAPRRP